MTIELVLCYSLNVTQCFAVPTEVRAEGLLGCFYGGNYERRRDGSDLVLKGVRCDDAVHFVDIGFLR